MWKCFWTAVFCQWRSRPYALPYMRGWKKWETVVHFFIKLIRFRPGIGKPFVILVLFFFRGIFLSRLIYSRELYWANLGASPSKLHNNPHREQILNERTQLEHEKTEERGKGMSIWIFLVVIGVWFLLQAYILPKLGISTWLKNSCQVGNTQEQTLKTPKKLIK